MNKNIKIIENILEETTEYTIEIIVLTKGEEVAILEYESCMSILDFCNNINSLKANGWKVEGTLSSDALDIAKDWADGFLNKAEAIEDFLKLEEGFYEL